MTHKGEFIRQDDPPLQINKPKPSRAVDAQPGSIFGFRPGNGFKSGIADVEKQDNEDFGSDDSDIDMYTDKSLHSGDNEEMAINQERPNSGLILLSYSEPLLLIPK